MAQFKSKHLPIEKSKKINIALAAVAFSAENSDQIGQLWSWVKESWMSKWKKYKLKAS